MEAPVRNRKRRKLISNDSIVEVEIGFGGQRDAVTGLVRRLERRKVRIRYAGNAGSSHRNWVQFNIRGPQHSVRQSLLGELTTLMEELDWALREQTYWPGPEGRVVGENNPLGVSRVYWSGKGRLPPAIQEVESAMRHAG